MDFGNIKQTCEKNTRISSRVVDEFLIYYAAERNNLESIMNIKFSEYRHITVKFQKEWVNMLKSQYIAHRIFRQNGLIKSYLNHSAIKNLRKEDLEYLENQAENPWRFSFSAIKDNPYKDFYLMEDIFRYDEFLLYSPGITRTAESQPVNLWLNMIAFNGTCWQSYGPICFYRSFGPDDIFFFASEINTAIEDEESLLSDVENDPLPYMMLISGANYPVMVNRKDEILHVQAEYELDEFETKELKDSFKTEYNKGVYRLILKRWGMHPHFSQAYYDENNKTILLSAMTDRGFTALIEAFNRHGYDFPTDPFIRVCLPMVETASSILKKQIDLIKYEKLFSKETSPAVKNELEKLNQFISLALPDINAGRIPDIDKLSKEAGVDSETAGSIIEELMKKLKK
jgi:hypothetical protein